MPQDMDRSITLYTLSNYPLFIPNHDISLCGGIHEGYLFFWHVVMLSKTGCCYTKSAITIEENQISLDKLVN